MNRLRTLVGQSLSKDHSKASQVSDEPERSFSKDGSQAQESNRRKLVLQKVPSANSRGTSSRMNQTFGPFGIPARGPSSDKRTTGVREPLPPLEQLNRSDITLQGPPQANKHFTEGQTVLSRKYSQVRRNEEPPQLSMDVLGKHKVMQFLLHKAH